MKTPAPRTRLQKPNTGATWQPWYVWLHRVVRLRQVHLRSCTRNVYLASNHDTTWTSCTADRHAWDVPEDIVDDAMPLWDVRYAANELPTDGGSLFDDPESPPRDDEWSEVPLTPPQRLALHLLDGKSWPVAPPPRNAPRIHYFREMDWFGQDNGGENLPLVDRTYFMWQAVEDMELPDAVETAGQADYIATDEPRLGGSADDVAIAASVPQLAPLSFEDEIAELHEQHKAPEWNKRTGWEPEEENARKNASKRADTDDWDEDEDDDADVSSQRRAPSNRRVGDGDPRTGSGRWRNEWYEPDEHGVWTKHVENTYGRCAYRGWDSTRERAVEPPYYLRPRCSADPRTCKHAQGWSRYASIVEGPPPEPVQPLSFMPTAKPNAPYSIGQTVQVVPGWGGKTLHDERGTVLGYSPDNRYVVVQLGRYDRLYVLPEHLCPAPAVQPALTPAAARRKQDQLRRQAHALDMAPGRALHEWVRHLERPWDGPACPWPARFPLLNYVLPYDWAAAHEWECDLDRPREQTAVARLEQRQHTDGKPGRPLARPRRTPALGCTFLHYRTPSGQWKLHTGVEPVDDAVWEERWILPPQDPTKQREWQAFWAEESATWRVDDWEAREFAYRFPWGIPLGLVSAWQAWVAKRAAGLSAGAQQQAFRQQVHDQITYAIAERAAQMRGQEQARKAVKDCQAKLGRWLPPIEALNRRHWLYCPDGRRISSWLLDQYRHMPYFYEPEQVYADLGACLERLVQAKPTVVPWPGEVLPEETGLWVSTGEAARLLGVSQAEIRQWRKRCRDAGRPLPEDSVGIRGSAIRLDAVLAYARDLSRLRHQPTKRPIVVA